MASNYRIPRKDLDLAPTRPSIENYGGRRLSKPRTTTLATSPSTSALESSSALSPRHSPASHRSQSTLDLLSPNSTLSPTKSRHALHSSSFEDVGRHNSMEEASSKKASTVKEKISRTSTILSKRASVRLSLGPLKSQSRLSLQTASDVSTEDKDRIIDEIRQKAHNDSTIALSYCAPSESEESKEQHAPIRRRSLFTPGLATRNPNDLLKRAPDPVELVEEEVAEYQYYYNPQLSESSPLGRLAALDLANGRRPFTPTSRCSTPGDMDRGLLGNQCTLRITNGAASPGPSLFSLAPTSRKSSGEPYYQESFYTASEGGIYDDQDLAPQLQNINRRSFEFVDGHTASKPQQLHGRIYTSLKGPREQTRVASPLRHDSVFDDQDSAYFDPPTSNSESYFNQHPALPVDASTLAQQYINDIASGSPFASTVNLQQTTQFESTTKTNEFEAELFDDPASRPSSACEVAYPSPATHEQPQTWSTTYTTGNGNHVQMESSTNVQQSVVTYTSSTTVQSFSSAVPVSSQQRPKPEPTTASADSGYSSSTSLRSLKLGKNRASPLSSLPSNSSAASSINISREDSFDKGKRDVINTAPTTVANFDSHLNASFGVDTPLVTNLDEVEHIARPLTRMQSRLLEPAPQRGRSPEAKTAYRPSFEGVRLPTPAVSTTSDLTPIPGSPNAVEPAAAEEKTARARSSSRPGKKLQKKPRPKSMPPPTNRITVSGNRDVSGTHVPDIPLELAARHAARLQDFPPLDRTVSDFKGETRRDEDLEIAHVSAPLKFPSPHHSPVETTFSPKKRVFSGRRLSMSKNTSQHFPPEEKRPSLEPTKSWRRRSRSRQPSPEVADVSNISDFGDMSALGHGPYDAATITQNGPNKVRSKRGSLIHPHQLTTAMPRAKSMYALNDAQAAELAQLRNYYNNVNHARQLARTQAPAKTQAPKPPSRAPPPPPSTTEPQDHSPRHQRRSSRDLPSSRRSFDDRGGIPGKMPRAKSLALDAPPVPAIPVRAQVDDMERQAKASNRQSLQHTPSSDKWQSFSAAWAQRRKSAGASLHARPAEPARAESDSRVVAATASQARPERSARPHHSVQVPRGAAGAQLAVPKSLSRASSQYSQAEGPAPSSVGGRLAPPAHQGAPPSLNKSPSSTSLRSRDLGVSVAHGTVARLSGRFESVQQRPEPISRSGSDRSLDQRSGRVENVGRFENGFGYGFEPGRGLGGSAGTRGNQSVASRKSVEWGRAYGVDLSDVPIMVQAAGSR